MGSSSMFLVNDRRFGSTYLVFTWDDPRKQGFGGDVVEDVKLDYDMEAVHNWPEGSTQPEVCVGRAPADPKHYKVFRYCSDLKSAGYRAVAGMPVVFGSWTDYLKVRLNPPDPQQTSEEAYFDYLDNLDEDARQWRRHAPTTDAPSGHDRDAVAAWLAQKHFLADSGIREIWYLPKGAPPGEIRLLELNDRFAGNGANVEAIDFGLDLDGATFRLLVADITSDQLEQIKQDLSDLPPGWSLDAGQVWRRRAV